MSFIISTCIPTWKQQQNQNRLPKLQTLLFLILLSWIWDLNVFFILFYFVLVWLVYFISLMKRENASLSGLHPPRGNVETAH